MSVDVVTEVEIRRRRAEVADFAADPSNAPIWYENIKSAGWDGPENLAVGGRVRFIAQFLGRKLTYTYVIREFAAGSRLVMATSDGPFAMETTYEWTDSGADSTRMTLRNRGQPTGFARIAAAAMERAMRRANEKDLRQLKTILEARG